MIQKLCRNCFNSFTQYNSLQKLCGLCYANKYTKPKKPMKHIGKITKKLIEQRGEWIKDNPPNHQGYYTCHICLTPVHIDEVNVEHVKSKARSPELRFVRSNLQPSHPSCNEQKGSRSY